jgi:tRNA U34 5-methylaminomethyl-2-thiouridine-forming methyltransferase MnmC
MPQVLEILLLALLLLALAYLLRPQEGWAWARRHLKGLVDFREVEAAFKALEGRERELSQALAALHLLPKTREELERALEEVREERRRLVALLESLAAERALAKGDLEAARKLEAHLADLREVLASLREGRR